MNFDSPGGSLFTPKRPLSLAREDSSSMQYSRNRLSTEPIGFLTDKQTRFSCSLIPPRPGVAAPEFKSNALLLHLPLFAGIQFLSHEIMLVPDGMILEHPEYAVPEPFVKWSCLKTERVKVGIGATALDRIGLGTLHQFLAKATPSHRRCYSKRFNVEPSRPNMSDQSAQYLTVFVPEKECDRIPFRLSCARNAIVIDHRLHNVAQIDSGIRIEDNGRVAHTNKWKKQNMKMASVSRCDYYVTFYTALNEAFFETTKLRITAAAFPPWCAVLQQLYTHRPRSITAFAESTMPAGRSEAKTKHMSVAAFGTLKMFPLDFPARFRDSRKFMRLVAVIGCMIKARSKALTPETI